ncbi:MAG TPA: neuraminidase-like domain-containing protein, partial [Kofleriaceae bacterium]|nr:neuraminidase-like domain-containing protein [Kofleriaceae bacterium]
ELDRILGELQHDWSPAETELTDPVINQLAWAWELQTTLDLSVDEVALLIGPLGADDPVFARTFNPPALVAAGGVYPQETTRFLHPALRAGTGAPADVHLVRLMAVLGLGLEPLGRLVRGLAPELGFSPTGPEEQRGPLLTANNLQLLYRYARLARALGISTDELLRLVDVVSVPRALATVGDLRGAEAMHRWQVGSGYTLDDVATATQHASASDGGIDSAAVAQATVAGTAAAVTFAPTVLAVATGISEASVTALLEANPNLLTPAATGELVHLADGVDLATVPITIPAGVMVPGPAPGGPQPLTAQAVRDALAPYQPGDVLARRLATALGLPTDRLEALARFAGVSLGTAVHAAALRAENPGPIAGVVDSLRPALVAFRAPVWTAAAIGAVAGNPGPYGLPLPPSAPTIDVNVLFSLSRMAKALARGADLDAWQRAIAAYDPSGSEPRFPATAAADVAEVLGVDVGLVHGLREHVVSLDGVIYALDQLGASAALATRLGVDGEVLAAAVATVGETLERAADALAAAGAGDAKAAAEVEQGILEARRDALVDFVRTRAEAGQFDRPAELSAYFLTDVEAGGCQTSSRVIAATGSVQQYVQRSILGLEQAGGVELRLGAEALAEWEWRKNYRVWEANRKVFLWPENYLAPDVRDDKTPLGEELERALFQTDLGDTDVADAYATYLKGFEDLANLTIAGAWHDAGNDVLHLFGATSSDPPVYYYRTASGLLSSGRDPARGIEWSPWHPVDLAIPGRRVAPVVVDGRLH